MFPLEEDGSVGEPLAIKDRALETAPGVLYSATAKQNPNNELEYLVAVEVYWETSGVRRAQRFETILLREIAFGERMRRRFVERSVSQ